jgi:YgiT-type zinc finger domain-containing protein
MGKVKKSDMARKSCGTCDGKLKEGITDFIVQVGDDIIKITKVPALICEDCGEKYYSPETSKKIDVVMKDYFENKRSHAKNKKTELSYQTVYALQVELPA